MAVNDDDATPTAITLSVDDNSVAEGDSPAPTISVTATADGSTQFGVAKTVRVSVTPRSDTTSVNYVDMTAVSDFDITIPAGTASHSQSFTLTPDNDIVDETDNTVTVSGAISGDSATTINSATITLADDDATPTAITLSASPSTITEDGGGQTITVTAAVGGTRFGVAKTVAVAVAGHDTAGAVQFSQVSNFNINIAAEAASGQGQFTLTPTDNNTVDNDGEATISGTLASATVAGASVTITNDDSAPVTVAMAASDGDANGNAVEGANTTTGYRTITITLGRALTGAETVTVPLTADGATVTTDYTFGLQPTTQTGVSLTTSGTHTAQNPAVVFSAGASSATLRLTPADNNDRTQPYVVIDYGTGGRAPSVSGVTLGDVTGGPIGVVLVDDETGDIEVPSSWGLAPSGLSGGDDFRLLFRTSSGRDATSSDIAVYDAFVRGVLAGGGHNDIKPYAGFFKVFGGTRSTSGSTGTAARVHNGMATAHTGHLQNGPWTDGSTRATVGNAAGVPTYWLNGAILANNYADLCDLAWSSGSGVTTGWDTDDPRNEDGTRNIPTGAISNYAPYETWTGSGNACEAYDHPLGASTVSRSSADSGGGQELLHGSAVANTGIHPLYGYSPVFKIEDTTAPSEVTVAADWALIPSGISAGGKFRLLFVTSTQRDASATDIATYNTFVQNRAAAGHTAIRSHSAEYRVVASTASVDARDNSATTGTGVPIYWLGGSNSNRVADNYADFYDGNWDSYVNTNENGAGSGNATVWTGSNDNGTKDSSNYLGASSVQYGQLFLATTNDPFTRFTSGNGNSRNFYGLSPVYTVQASAVVPELTFSSATYSGAEDGGTISVTVNASSAPMSALTVNLGKTDGTATGGGVDFTNPAATFTFPASMTSHAFTVSITDDMILENHEDFTLTLQSGTGYTVGTTQASTTVTITDQDTVTVRIEDATDTVSEDDEGVTITVLKDGDADIPVQATLTPSDGTATGGSDATLAGIDYDNDTLTPIAIPAGVSSVDVEVAINDDSVAEASETFSVALTAVGGQRGVSVASPSSATVTITDNDPISVTMAGSDGDSDGNAVEGASGATGYRTITINLGQAVPSGQTVTVPLTVQGATIATDYTFGLRGTNTGVSLTTSGGTHTAQNPAVVFAAGASSATLRLTPVDNNLLSQPHVVIDYGTGGRAPSVTGGLTLGAPTGGPIGVVLVDDESTSSSGTETDPIEVPSDWPLTPSGLSAGDKFRLMFMTSEGRDASSTDIANYDAFVRRIGAGYGHQDIRPYIGYFKAFGNTRSTTATSQNVAARGHVGMWTSSSNVWTDGSTSDSSAGTPIYWLDGNQISDNYFDFCDSSWDNRWSSSTNHLKHEDGNAADGSKVWTGMNNNCTLHANALGATQTVWAPGTQTPSGGPLNKGSEANTNGNRFYAMSPVFKVETAPAPPVPPKPTGFTATAGNGQVTLSWNDPNQSSITSWKYRQKAGSGSYGSYITISGSSASTTSHTVTGLTNGVTYTFQVLAHASNAGGSIDGLPSDERTATPTATPVVIDPNAPQVVSIKRHAQEVRNLGMSLVWRVEFDKHLPNVYASDFTLSGTTAGLDVRHDLSNYDPVTYKTVVFVYAQGGDLETVSGTVTLNFASDHNVVDFEGRRLASTNPTGANQNTFTLNPNETLVYFTQENYYVDEGNEAVLTLRLSRLRDTATSIRLSATPLTATGNGVDYHGSTFTATIPAYRASGTVKIRTSDDTLTEDEESFRLDINTLNLPTGVVRGNVPGATANYAYVLIRDEDTATAKAKTEPDLVFDNAYLTWYEARGCTSFTDGTGPGPSYNVKLKNRPAGPVEVWIEDPDDDYRSDYVAKGRLYVENSPYGNGKDTHTILRFTPDNWDEYQTVNVKVRCADHYTAQIPIKHRMYTDYTGDKGKLSHAYPGYSGVVDKGWTVHVKVREANPPIVAKGLPAPDQPVDVKEGGHLDFEIILSESAFEHHNRLPVYLSARGGKAAGVKRRDGSARSCGGPFDDCLYFTPENRTQWVRLFAINPGRDELKVEIPQLLWGDLADLPLVRDWDMRWPVEVLPVSQGAPAEGAAVAPTQAISGLQVTAIDDASASVTWNAVEHARFYEVSWEAESSDGQAVISGIESMAGTSTTIQHNATEDMTLTVTVTPEYVDGNGITQRMETLAATATLNIGPSSQDLGNGGTNGGGGDGGPVEAGEGVDLPAPVAHWRFDGDADDSAGSSDGTARNGAAFAANSAGAGVGSHALSLDGVDDYVDLASHASSFPLGNAARTVAGWFNADAGNQGQSFLSYGPNVEGKRFSIAADRTQVVVGVSGHAWGVNGLDLADGWHHVAVSYAGGDSDTVSIYLDGALQTTSTLGGTPQPLDTQTGPAAFGRNVGGTKHYAGSIDDVRLYDAALGAEQVQALFHRHPQAPRTPPTPPPVTAAVAATATPALAEGNLDGAQVTLTLDAGAFAATLAASDVTASGVSGVSVSSVTRDSDAQATARLAFDGTDFDVDATLTLAVSATALAHSDANLSATLPVTAVDEPPPPPVTTSITASATPALAEDNLDGAQVTLTLDAGSLAATLAASDVAASGVAGVSVSSVTRHSDSQATATLSFDGTDFDSNATLTLTLSAAALSHSDAALSATLPVAAVDEATPVPPPPPSVSIPAPVVHWRFDGDADDSAGSSHGAVRNGASFTTAARVGSHALSLDGSDDFVDLDPYVSGFLRGNSDRSVTGWFRADAGNQRQTFFTYGPNVEGRRFTIAADRTQALVAVTGHAWGVNNLSLADGWHHIAVTFAGSRSDDFSIYLDGVKQPASTLGGSARQVDTRTGSAAIGRSVGGNAHYGGDIDDVRVYGYALSAEQVAAIAERRDALSAASPDTPLHVPLLPSAANAEGVVRIANLGVRAGAVEITAIDDAGWRRGPITLDLDARGAVEFTAHDLERGNAALGLADGMGPGTGDWRLEVATGLNLEARAHVQGSGGASRPMHGTVPAEGGVHQLALFLPASVEPASILRLTNRGGEATVATITGTDDAGAARDAVRVSIPAGASVRLGAAELEQGGTALDGALGDGAGLWRLGVTADGDLAVMHLIEGADGRLVNLSRMSVSARRSSGAYGVARFPVGTDASGQRGLLRIVNRSAEAGTVRIEPSDDSAWDYEPLTLALGAGAAVNLDAWDLELGNPSRGLARGAGPGAGAWRLAVSSDLDIEVLTYVRSPTGLLEPLHGGAVEVRER